MSIISNALIKYLNNLFTFINWLLYKLFHIIDYIRLIYNLILLLFLSFCHSINLIWLLNLIVLFILIFPTLKVFISIHTTEICYIILFNLMFKLYYIWLISLFFIFLFFQNLNLISNSLMHLLFVIIKRYNDLLFIFIELIKIYYFTTNIIVFRQDFIIILFLIALHYLINNMLYNNILLNKKLHNLMKILSSINI